MAATLDREPYDPEEPYYGRKNEYKSADYIPKVHKPHKPEDSQLLLARKALGILALIHGFGLEEIALIAEVALGDPFYAESLEDRLFEETGIIFTLTPEQWKVIHSEVETTTQGGSS